ncbi:MAG TPA: HAMP domain-containing sensor histidine kinase [Gaiellaceae bacterium]|nr:HAMP domain-containing sensor histidine kinase [Gaiellaceae bacterium]
MTLRRRLFATIALSALLSLTLALAIGALLTRRAVERNTLRDVSAQMDLLVEREREALVPFSRLRSLQEFLERQDEQVIRVALDGSAPLLPPDRAARLRRGARLDGALESDGTRYLYAARLVAGKGFILLRPASSTNSAWRPHVEGLLLAAVAAALLAALVAFLSARALARPLRRVADATRSLATATGAPPVVPVEGPRELASLARSFNEVAVHLATAREAEQAFLLSVSHELKTPLTAIRGYAEALQDEALSVEEAAATIVAESRRLERLVGDLLDLARMRKAEFSFRREPIDLRDTALEAVRRYESQAREFGVALALVGDDAAPALGDADRTLQIVSNLVENALRLTPAGGSVEVVARPGEIQVRDTGPGLGPDEVERAFERFFLHSRYGRERPVGSGLGLAIVQTLAEGMGGSVAVASAPGELTVFTVRLPTAGFTRVLPPANEGLTEPLQDHRVKL